MRNKLLVLLLCMALAFVLFGPILAFAAGNTSACYNISDSDIRTFCLARAKNEPAQCYNIVRQDLRQQCLAEVSR